MQELKFDIKIIKGLNLNNLVPTPLFKFIVQQQFKVINNIPNLYNIATIKKVLLAVQQIFTEQRIAIDDSQAFQAAGSLMYILRFATNKNWPVKALNTFFKQNTLLQTEKLAFILERFESQISNKEDKLKTLSLGRLINLQWNILNCVQDQQGNILNKLHIKLELTTQNTRAQTKKQRFILSLPQFKAFMQQFKIINNTINSK